MCYQLLVQVPASEERATLEAIYSRSGLHTSSATLNGQSALCLSKEGGCSCSLAIAQATPEDAPALAPSSYEPVAQALAAAAQVSSALNFAFHWADGSGIPRTETTELTDLLQHVLSGSILSNVVYRVAHA